MAAVAVSHDWCGAGEPTCPTRAVPTATRRCGLSWTRSSSWRTLTTLLKPTEYLVFVMLINLKALIHGLQLHLCCISFILSSSSRYRTRDLSHRDMARDRNRIRLPEDGTSALGFALHKPIGEDVIVQVGFKRLISTNPVVSPRFAQLSREGTAAYHLLRDCTLPKHHGCQVVTNVVNKINGVCPCCRCLWLQSHRA